MSHVLCDIYVSLHNVDSINRINEFCSASRGEHGLPSLTIALEAVEEISYDTPDIVEGVTAFSTAGESVCAWNVYDNGERDSALLSISSGVGEIKYTRFTSEDSILNMLMVAFLPVVARNNGLLFHASLVEYEGRAVAFTASSGTGKSTQADLWHEHLGAEIMNGDRAFVRRFDEEWRAYGSPWAGSSPYIKNVKAPLAGIVVLKQAPENRIRRLNAAEVMAYLYNNVRYPFWDEEATAASLETLDALIREIPIFLLKCRPDEEAVRITRDAIFGK